jgi:hypothetical protein
VKKAKKEKARVWSLVRVCVFGFEGLHHHIKLACSAVLEERSIESTAAAAGVV